MDYILYRKFVSICIGVLYNMVTNMILFALIALVLYVVYTRNSVEGMITLGGADYQNSQSSNSVARPPEGSYEKTAQSLLKETEQYPRSRKTMLNILDSDLMRYFDVSPRRVADLRDTIESEMGDVTDIRNKIKELVELQKNSK
jgi:hypothetical protein